MKTIAEHLASLVVAIKNCQKSGNSEWEYKHKARLETIVREFLPRGSGLDAGCYVHVLNSTDSKLVICTEFHHMNENGYYDGWTKHRVIAKASLAFGLVVEVTNGARNDIGDYLAETFRAALEHKIDSVVIDAMMESF